jgi:hypothetical protein
LLPLFPPLALLVGHYLCEFAIQDWSAPVWHFWIALCFFVFVALAGVAFLPVVWLLRPDVLWPILPVGIALAVGGASTAISVHRRKPLAAVLCVVVMMLALTAALVSGLFPYMERFKSHRAFSGEINRQVPASAPLYVYEDTTNDFNYYTAREVIAVLDTPAEVAELRQRKQISYLLIKKRALQRLPDIAAEPVIATAVLGDTTWHLLALGR